MRNSRFFNRRRRTEFVIFDSLPRNQLQKWTPLRCQSSVVAQTQQTSNVRNPIPPKMRGIPAYHPAPPSPTHAPQTMPRNRPARVSPSPVNPVNPVNEVRARAQLGSRPGLGLGSRPEWVPGSTHWTPGPTMLCIELGFPIPSLFAFDSVVPASVACITLCASPASSGETRST